MSQDNGEIGFEFPDSGATLAFDGTPMRKALTQFPFLPLAFVLLLGGKLAFFGLGWVGVVALVAALLWLSLEVIRWLMRGRSVVRIPEPDSEERAPSDEELVSLVYFLSDVREPTEEDIRNCVSRALEIRFDPDDPDAEHFVVEFASADEDQTKPAAFRQFMLRLPAGLFYAAVSREPYVEDPADFARRSIRDKRLRKAVEEHLAWISVDFLEKDPEPEDKRDAYAVIGKILAAMAGPDCLALYCPELQRCNEFDPLLLDDLASGSPLRLFTEPTFEPIIEVAEDDPRMRDAVGEALARWPEFESAFARREEDKDANPYLVKAEFREGTVSEFMWLTVTGLTAGSVRGVLMNAPHELLEVHRGTQVEVELDRLNDWIYPGPDGELVGGFTLDVLADEE